MDNDNGINTTPNNGNKRRYERFPVRLTLCLTHPVSEELAAMIEATSLTVDISELGLRFESRNFLQAGTSVHFSLCREYPRTLVKGVGQIKWCHGLENAPLYHAGLAFTGVDTARIVRQCLTAVIN